MSWHLLPEDLEPWRDAPAVLQLHATRYWLGERDIPRIIALTRQTAELERVLHRLLRELRKGLPTERVVPALAEGIDTLTRYQLVWQVPNSLVRDVIDALWPLCRSLPLAELQSLLRALEPPAYSPIPPALLESPAQLLLVLEGLLPARRVRGEVTAACKALLTVGPNLTLPQLASRLLVLAAHQKLRGSPAALLAQLPDDPSDALLPVLLYATSRIDHPRSRRWSDAQRNRLERLLVSHTDSEVTGWWSRFLLVDAALSLGWAARSRRLPPHTQA